MYIAGVYRGGAESYRRHRLGRRDPPDAPFHGKEAVGGVYSSILDTVPDVLLDPVRFRAEDGRHVVDESILTWHVHGEWAGMNGGGAPMRVRILHIFELRDGLICYENARFDAAGVQRQISKVPPAAVIS